MASIDGRFDVPERAGSRMDPGTDLAAWEPGVTAIVETLRRAVSVPGRGAGTRPAASRLGVAFSGGVDSSVLLALAVRALGAERVVPVLAVSASLPAVQRRLAHDVAGFIGVPVLEVATREDQRPEYVANGPDRCYHCKDELFSRVDAEVAAPQGLVAVAYGENADDARRQDRPGSRAAVEHGVLRPLADAGWGKAEVRAVARALGLPSADTPAAPCLASRIPHHQPVDAGKLRQVEQAEDALRHLGFPVNRVRHHGEIARLELPPPDLPRAAADPLRQQVLLAVRAAGFRFVALDVAGLQSGAFTLALLTADADHHG
jgi:uncharacterized protein